MRRPHSKQDFSWSIDLVTVMVGTKRPFLEVCCASRSGKSATWPMSPESIRCQSLLPKGTTSFRSWARGFGHFSGWRQ